MSKKSSAAILVRLQRGAKKTIGTKDAGIDILCTTGGNLTGIAIPTLIEAAVGGDIHPVWGAVASLGVPLLVSAATHKPQIFHGAVAGYIGQAAYRLSESSYRSLGTFPWAQDRDSVQADTTNTMNDNAGISYYGADEVNKHAVEPGAADVHKRLEAHYDGYDANVMQDNYGDQNALANNYGVSNALANNSAGEFQTATDEHDTYLAQFGAIVN